MAVVRCLHLGALMLIFGASAYLALLRWRLPRAYVSFADRSWLFVLATATALVSALASLPLTTAEIAGSWSAALDWHSLKAVLTETTFGRILFGRAAGLIALMAICPPRTPVRLIVASILAALLLIALSITSHAAASADAAFPPLLRAANDAAHLLAGGFWLGGLFVLFLLFDASGGATMELLRSVRLFSDWGTFVVVVIVATGIANGALIFYAGGASWTGLYARLLAMKIAFAFAMIAIAAFNRWRLTPAMEQSAAAAIPLQRNILVELLIGFVIVGIAAVLGSLAPA